MLYLLPSRVHSLPLMSIIALVVIGELSYSQSDEVSFNRDIRPILSDNCFKCHGPDEHDRQADLRFDTREGIEDASDLISPREPDESELLRRLFTGDEDELMPPHDSGKKLTAEQKQKILAWIEQGAGWQKHWSFVTPKRPKVPATDSPWPVTEIDRFVMQKLQEMDLQPGETADRATLIRRVCLDLTGLPPDTELLDDFLENKSENWYEELVDRLLDSPHYGEHMARFWLDAARYADTHGLHLDNYRESWLYRDWVIDAFNNNLPYRDFVIEQLAGDLLENPTEPQLIATGFNRAHVTTNEGGSIVEEVLVRNVVDRVSTTGTVFLGLTVGCAQCHDHKYDPISQKEFYQLYAFFNSLDANPMDGNIKDHAPVLRYFTDDEKSEMEDLQAKRDSLKQEIDLAIEKFDYVDPLRDANESEFAVDLNDSGGEPAEFIWFDDTLPDGAEKSGAWQVAESSFREPFSGESSFVSEAEEFIQIVFQKSKQLLRFRESETLFANVYLDPENPPQQIMLQFNDGNWEHRAYWGENKINFGADGTTSRKRLGDLPETGKWVRLEVAAEDVGFKKISGVNGFAFSQYGGKVFWDNAGVVTSVPQTYDGDSFRAWRQFQIATGANELPADLRKKLTRNSENDEDTTESGALDDYSAFRNYYLRNVYNPSRALIADRVSELEKLNKLIDDKTKAAPTTLIWKEKKKAEPAYVLNRGEYDQKGESVERQTPDALPRFNDDLPRNRLGLAFWLVDPEHPLTARIAVNRFWQQFFGSGIVATADDFGAQGENPSHPEMLDWLSVDFVESGWNVKRLVKFLVMSSTYRQSANTTPAKLNADPENRYFSRGPRFRLDAEMLRDQALAVSGLLVPAIGGPAVKPPQPDGLWFAVGYTRSNTVRFKKDAGADKVHRRSIYTFWKRTAPPPQMSTFDAPSRESCIVRRERTNTPLQALLLMNDPQYVEAARHLAQATLDQAFVDHDESIRFMFRKAMARNVDGDTLAILKNELNSTRTEFKENERGAIELIAIGENPAETRYNTVELASYTMLANLIMNMDEFINKN